MAFRGTALKEEDVSSWNHHIGKEFNIPGLSSTSEDLGEALKFAKLTHKHLQQGKKAFLFVFVVATRGALFHLDTSEYTAYPGEREVLLREGKRVYVLGREELYSIRFTQSFNIFYAFIPSFGGA